MHKSVDNRSFIYEQNLICDLQQFLFVHSMLGRIAGREKKLVCYYAYYGKRLWGEKEKPLDHIIKEFFTPPSPLILSSVHSLSGGKTKRWRKIEFNFLFFHLFMTHAYAEIVFHISFHKCILLYSSYALKNYIATD